MDTVRTEVRLAVVLNGGVSLAVWMGGVTHEIDLLRRASRVANGATLQEVGGVATYDEEIFDQWVELCRRHEIGRVVVDVVSGTSAGGLNGTLLAAAVARGSPLDPPDAARDFPRLRGVWMNDAKLEERKLIPRARAEDPPSILDGGFFREAIRGVLSPQGGGPKRGEAGGGSRITPEPVTLFVTATALGSAGRHYRDAYDQEFHIPDHRRLYRFQRSSADAIRFRHPRGDGPRDDWWRGSVDDHFSAGRANDALVDAARASASFPIAFAPIRESSDLAQRRQWPPAAFEPSGGRYLLDGGILDNAPFQPVLDAVARTPVNGLFRRLLIHVVPSAGEPYEDHSIECKEPKWSSVVGSALEFPKETDIRDDIELVQQLVNGAEGFLADPEQRFKETVEGNPAMLIAANGLLAQYRAARAVGGLLEIRAAVARADPGITVSLRPFRAIKLAAILASAPPWVPTTDPEPFEAAYAGAHWSWGLAAAERVVRLFARDLRGQQRIGANVGPEHVVAVSRQLSRIEAVRDAFRERVEQAAGVPDTDEGLLDWAAYWYARLQVQEALAWCVRQAADAYSRGRGPGNAEPASAVRAGLAVEVCTQAFTAYQPFVRTAPFEFLRLGPDVDTPLVDTDRVSREEARTNGSRKLYGTHLVHFAAFGPSAWRHWDWTAGRLDAQVHLARALLTPTAAGTATVSAPPQSDGPTPAVPAEGDSSPPWKQAADAWSASVQRRTVAAELRIDPPAWQLQRQARWDTKDDRALIEELRSSEEGEAVALRVVDAVMRAIPHPAALGKAGLLANSLLARHPRRRFVKWWAPPARLLTRRRWRRMLESLGRPSSATHDQPPE